MSVYFSNLSDENKTRYTEKMSGLGFAQTDDPFLLLEQKNTASSTWKDDVTLWPKLDFGKILVYLVQTPGPFTLEQMNAYRSLEAYNFFINGWVQTCYYKGSKTGHCIITSKVNRSQAVNEKPHMAWVGFSNKTDTVDCAHCSCMAGLGEVCSHVAAILFKVQCNTELGHNEVSCTSVPCEWNQTFVKKVEAVRLNDVDFRKPKRPKRKWADTATPQEEFHLPPVADPQDLIHDLKKVAPGAAVISVVEPKHTAPSERRFPQLLSNLYAEENVLLHENDLNALCLTKFGSMFVSKQQQENLEKSTRSQSKSGLWKWFRNGRITSSNFYDVLHTSSENPSKSLILKICDGTNFKTEATGWGIENENKGLSSYVKTMHDHENFVLSGCGLHVNQRFPHLGATPNGVVDCSCCGKGLVEVKCPFKHKEEHPCSVIDQGYCLNQHEPGKCDNRLKYDHRYFYQVQGQMGVCEADYCDFVSFTPKGLHVERILFDVEFFQNLVQKLETFYINFILPELLTRRLKYKPA